MRSELDTWERVNASKRRVWLEGHTVRTCDGVIGIWNPNREILTLIVEPATRMHPATVAAVLVQSGLRDPREIAVLLDALYDHLASAAAS